MTNLTRRNFMQLLGVAGTLGLAAPHTLARTFTADKRSLGWLANGTAKAEGQWNLTKIEGRIPKDLNGALIRTAPGVKESFGVRMRHLFDGDSYLSHFTLRDGKAALQARFLNTPQRLAEQKAGKMLYGEYGTPAPAENLASRPKGPGKNQPSVNIIRWDKRLLGFSEGWHPVAIDEKTLTHQGNWDFYGTLPRDVSFTAHPRFAPDTGEGYAYGLRQGPGMALTVFRMELNGKLTQLYALPQPNFQMVHDMLLTQNHIVFVLAPVFYDIGVIMSGRGTTADAIRYAEKNPTRIVILRRDGTGQPVTIEQPANVVFHHGNAYEQDGKIIIDSILSPNGDLLRQLFSWGQEKLPQAAPNQLTRLVLDPAQGRVVSRREVAEGIEFPRYDSRLTGRPARYLYAARFGPDEPFAAESLMRYDWQKGAQQATKPVGGRAFGEPVFAPRGAKEEQGWLLALGYDALKDQTFLEIRDAATLDFAARVWTGISFPLGFHGNFYAN